MVVDTVVLSVSRMQMQFHMYFSVNSGGTTSKSKGHSPLHTQTQNMLAQFVERKIKRPSEPFGTDEIHSANT